MKAQQATVHPKLVTQLERHFLQHGVPSSAQPQHPLGFRLSRPPADNSFKMLRQASSTSLAPICNFNRPHQSLSLIPALSMSSLGTPLGLGGAQRTSQLSQAVPCTCKISYWARIICHLGCGVGAVQQSKPAAQVSSGSLPTPVAASIQATDGPSTSALPAAVADLALAAWPMPADTHPRCQQCRC